MLAVFAGESNPFIEGVKTFRWWESSLSEDAMREGLVTVAARFNDNETSPAIVEQAVGDGRVIVFTTAVDADWGSWPQDPSYLVTMQELNRYMAGKSADAGSIRAGEAIRHPLDLTRYKLDALITDPRGEQTPVQPAAANGTAKQRNEAVWWVQFDETGRRGFYELQLTLANGGREHVLFAANLDASEGDLQRVDQRLLRRDLGDAPVEIVIGAGLLAVAATAARAELWLYILAALVTVMCVEQILAWWFGFRR